MTVKKFLKNGLPFFRSGINPVNPLKMKKLLLVGLVAGIVSCDNAGEVRSELDSAKNKLDTLANRIENSETIDSIQSKGGKILDSVKSKGGKLIDKAGEEINDIRGKDSAR